MGNKNHSIDHLLRDLQERAKELNCLYRVEELLKQSSDMTLEDLFTEIVKILPSGWRFPDLCQVSISYKTKKITTTNYLETPWSLEAPIVVQGNPVGSLRVSYSREIPATKSGYFLKEESRLINTVADRIGHTILHRELSKVFIKWEDIKHDLGRQPLARWRVVMDTLRKSDKKLFIYIAQKMLRNLCVIGVEEANQFLKAMDKNRAMEENIDEEDLNRPRKKKPMDHFLDYSKRIFQIAAKNMTEDQLLFNIEKWMLEDRSKFLVKAIDNPSSSLNDVIDAVTRFRHMNEEGIRFSTSIKKGLRVSLARRFFYDDLEFINVAKNYIDVPDYFDLVDRVIFHNDSMGNLGGKSAGLFLANRILSKVKDSKGLLKDLRTPKTWYITSDGLIQFLYYNDLEDVNEQKYKDIEEVRLEYPNIVQVFKNSHFPPKIVNGLMAALKDLGDNPIIVRSSSLLEDRVRATFSGKYKSLFLANQGTKEQRLQSLMDAIAEVYASTFAPDPIEYRTERGLLDFFEQMGIMIQEVVGTKIGDYFFPSFAGVAFSNNEFRWSPRIKREDGLIRLVPGLGTRAVDRVSDDYPILVAPGKADLRINQTPEEILRYATRRIDVINLKNNRFETIDIDQLLKKHGNQIPWIQHIVSTVRDTMIQPPTSLLNLDFDEHEMIVTFDGLFRRTPFIQQIKTMQEILQERIGSPVDIEFAHDGKHFYLLQCRPQSYSRLDQPAKIPRNIPKEKILFTANRYISNGLVPDISHIVYVDPDAYGRVSNQTDLQQVGKIVGKLNKLLPKKQFILMGPGRWGSRGDIKLGVSVNYSDINNTTTLIEIARKKGNYIPELSFGTHFFQDLVEASIRYLPLYPDEKGNLFNAAFFSNAPNILGDLLPKEKRFSHVIRVIDIPRTTNGSILRILMNADQESAVGYLADPGTHESFARSTEPCILPEEEDHWVWRYRMAEEIASRMDTNRFGVKAVYLFGSTKNATAGPSSNINLIIHFSGTSRQKKDLNTWLEGWSLSLAKTNFLRTGNRADGLLDIQYLTDEDIAKKNCNAVKLQSIISGAHKLTPVK
jgi:hypothetical protein